MTCSEAGIFAPFHLLMQAMTVMSEGRRLRHSLWFTLVDPGMFVFVQLEEWYSSRSYSLYSCRLLYWNSFFSIPQYFFQYLGLDQNTIQLLSQNTVNTREAQLGHH